MEMPEAVGQAFEAQHAGSDLVKRLLSLEITPGPEKPLIVVFTGYGEALAYYARKVSGRVSNAPIYVVGPDNLCASDPAKRFLDAESYRMDIVRLDKEEKTTRQVVADASQDSQSTPGQATVAARWIEEKGFVTALLVTAAYHQPRAYMTLLKSFIKRGIENRVRLVPKPYGLSRDWDGKDPDLKDNKSWATAFAEDELPRIIKYQQKGDVASWKELEKYLEGLS